MAVMSIPVDPDQPEVPKGLRVKRTDKGLEIRWQQNAEVHAYELERMYYRPGDLGLVSPEFYKLEEVRGPAIRVPHPEGLPTDQSWVVELRLKAKSKDGYIGEPAQARFAWDDQLSQEACEEDLRTRVDNFTKYLSQFMETRRAVPEILILGPQHHGKSSFGNHVDRCFHGDLSRFDQWDQAPGGVDERTMAVKRLKIQAPNSPHWDITFIDTPAFSVIDEKTERALHALLSSRTADGTRRSNFTMTLADAPDAAILVISLCHFRDQPDEMRRYLEKMAGVFKKASFGTVEFPYVVAASHRDEFLRDCQGDPEEALQQAVQAIKMHALTDHVYPITNYKKGSAGSRENNKETFDLLGQLLTKARGPKTPPSCFACMGRLLPCQ